MLEIQIPGFKDLALSHLVLDYNGTLAVDDELLPGAREVLTATASHLEIHVLTADTFGIAESQLGFFENLGAENSVVIGNGRNDRKLLAAAHYPSQSYKKKEPPATLASANIREALELLSHPKRLIATLPS